jgi:hypothetical protein
MDSADQETKPSSDDRLAENEAVSSTDTSELTYVDVNELRPEDDDGTCLRPLGLCELGGCCDVCWYRPDHPRFRKNESGNT